MKFRLLLILCLGHCLPAVLGAGSGISAHVGGTVTLPCDGSADIDTNKEADVLWMFGGKPVCWFENGSWCETDRYVARTWLGSIRQNNFSLVINPVRIKDAGVYKCQISGEGIRSIHLIVDGGRNQTAAVTPTKDPVCRRYREREDPLESVSKDKRDSDENPPGASSGRNRVVTGVIVGIVVVVGVVLVAAVLFRRSKNQPGTRRPADLIRFTEFSLIDMSNTEC